MAQIQQLLGGELPTLVFDCTGNAGSMHAAFDFVAHGGSLVLVGHIKGDLTFSDPHFHSHEMTLLASRNATSADFSWVIRCLQKGVINLDPWITHRAAPETIVADFPTWLDPVEWRHKGDAELRLSPIRQLRKSSSVRGKTANGSTKRWRPQCNFITWRLLL